MSNPFSDPEDWHFATIAGRDTPGLAEVSGASKPRKWDEKEGAGTLGASLTFRGDRLVATTLKLTLWEEDHFDEWEELHAFLKPLVKGKAVDFYHPAIEDLDVRSVVIEEIGQRTHVGGGKFEVELKLKEFRPPPKANATGSPDGSKSGSGKAGGSGNAAPTALSAQEQEIARLLSEAKKP